MTDLSLKLLQMIWCEAALSRLAVMNLPCCEMRTITLVIAFLILVVGTDGLLCFIVSVWLNSRWKFCKKMITDGILLNFFNDWLVEIWWEQGMLLWQCQLPASHAQTYFSIFLKTAIFRNLGPSSEPEVWFNEQGALLNSEKPLSWMCWHWTKI